MAGAAASRSLGSDAAARQGLGSDAAAQRWSSHLEVLSRGGERHYCTAGLTDGRRARWFCTAGWTEDWPEKEIDIEVENEREVARVFRERQRLRMR